MRSEMTNEDKRAALEQLEDKYGRITAETVIAAAKHPHHPLHGEFEWDDSVAAHQFRVVQARTLIRSVYIIEQTETQEVKAPKYIRDPDLPTAEPGYRSTMAIKRSEEASRSSILREFSMAGSHLSRARSIALVLGTTTEDIDDVLERVAGLRRTFDEPPTPGHA